MIKLRNDAVTDKVQSGLGFSGGNEEVMRSRSLNWNITNLTQKPLSWFFSFD
jgi:hypothetical protein